MKRVYAIADNIYSPLGSDSAANWQAVLQGYSGVKAHNKSSVRLKDFYASLIEDEILDRSFEAQAPPAEYTRLEKMYILSILGAIRHGDVDVKSDRTLFIFSTTKGNIDLLEQRGQDQNVTKRLKLSAMAQHVTRFFCNPNVPVVICNACISGVLALIVGSYYIREGLYEKVIVAGGDIISAFTVSGFQSLLALSQTRCLPFDKTRDGINLGEACATIVLSGQPQSSADTEIIGGATTNDANHISGPSKTGDGLFQAITHALNYSAITAKDIGYVSAHGTATLYNDEMETKAIHSAHLSQVPVNSLKNYFGHTLGAAGVLETVMAIWSLRNQTIVASGGYHEHGVSLPLAVVKQNLTTRFDHCLKTASGFGGCNAALILSKT